MVVAAPAVVLPATMQLIIENFLDVSVVVKTAPPDDATSPSPAALPTIVELRMVIDPPPYMKLTPMPPPLPKPVFRIERLPRMRQESTVIGPRGW